MQSLTIVGRRWFDRRYGNTYYSAIAIIDGKNVASIDYAYGYGDQYAYEMFELLENKGLLPYPVQHYQHGGHEQPWAYCREHGIEYTTHVSDVNRKRDL